MCHCAITKYIKSSFSIRQIIVQLHSIFKQYFDSLDSGDLPYKIIEN